MKLRGSVRHVGVPKDVVKLFLFLIQEKTHHSLRRRRLRNPIESNQRERKKRLDTTCQSRERDSSIKGVGYRSSLSRTAELADRDTQGEKLCKLADNTEKKVSPLSLCTSSL